MRRLTAEGKRRLQELIHQKLCELPDWADFLEDANVPLHILEEYLRCGRDEVLAEHLAGMAHALGLSGLQLFMKLQWERPEDDDLADDTPSEIAQEVPPLNAAELERRCAERLEQGDRKGYQESLNTLWDLLVASNSGDERTELAARVAGLLYKNGLEAHGRYNFLELCGAYNAARSLIKDAPESLDAALTCVKLATGVFEMKFSLQEFDNVESYIDELLPITVRHHKHEEFTLHSAACLCNLLQLCPYDAGIFVNRMMEILDAIHNLALRFLQNAELQLCYVRSLAFFLCYGKPRLKDEVYTRYYALAKNAFATRCNNISIHDLNEMKRMLAASGIVL